MNQGQSIFAQIISFFPRYKFQKCVNRYNGDYRVKRFTCYEQFLIMAFAQLTYRESLRDIETCFTAMQKKLYHCGIRCAVSKSTLADANQNRAWHIFGDFAQVLIQKAKHLYLNDSFQPTIDQAAYVVDSTTISLCLSLFPWSRYRYGKGAVKVHTALDLKGSFPSYFRTTNATICDHDILDSLPIEAGAFYIMDKGYFDLSRLYSLNLQQAFFVTRLKTNVPYRRLYSKQVNKETGLRCDQTIAFTSYKARTHYPEKIRLIKYYAEEKREHLTFLTNDFFLDALTIAELYKARWKIEVFFRWLKQHLRIKAFYGTSENAVKTQVAIAMCVYLLIAIIKKQLNISLTLYEILQILSITIFEKIPLQQALMKGHYTFLNDHFDNQLLLFN